MRPIIGAIVFLLAALLAAAAAPRPALTGTWFTEGIEGGDHFQSVFAVRPDGHFVKQFRDATCGRARTWREGGNWSFDGQRVLLDTAGDAMDPVVRRDVFDYHAGDTDHFSMTDEDTRITWKFVRVADGTRLDEGPCVS
jgi:hypothetical protein